MKRVRSATKKNTTHTLRQAVTRSLLTVALAGTAPLSFAGADIKIGDDAGISLGMGLRNFLIVLLCFSINFVIS